MAREALFNLLRTRIDLEDEPVIDLFSGTGFIAYEFCSRGALSVIAVEKHPGCVAFIRKTIDLLHLSMMSVIKEDVFRFLKSTNACAGLIFADPPYDLDTLRALPDLVLYSPVLRPGGLFVLEHGRKDIFQEHSCFSEERIYGKVHFTFFLKPS